MNIHHKRLRSAFHRNPPDAGNHTAFGIVKKPAIRRLEPLISSLFRHLHALSAFGRRFPYFPTGAALPPETAPAPVARPAWTEVIGRFLCEAARPTSVDADDIDVLVAFRERIESDLPSVRRPARRAA